MPEMPSIAEDVVLINKKYDGRAPRYPVARSLGIHVPGFAMPLVDRVDMETVNAGMLARMGRAPPLISHQNLKDLRTHVRYLCHKYLKPIAADVDVSFEKWIDETHYPESRKVELRKIYYAKPKHLPTKKEKKVKCFIKGGEKFPCYKFARGIYSRHDYFKCWSGPFFHALEKQMFKLPFFIKFIPVKDRPKYIKDRIFKIGEHYYCTDFSSFESHLVPKVMDVIELELYRYMFRNFKGVAKAICDTLKGKNICKFKRSHLILYGRRMSGEMCTSLGNGFTNFAICSYLCHKHNSECVGVFEGDDGLFRIDGPYKPTAKDFEDLGWRVKLEDYSTFSEASFCGLVADEDVLHNITDPRRAILKLGWTSSPMMHGGPAIMKALLRSKALSLLAEFPSCPIITSVALAYIRLTKGVEPIYNDNTWYGRYRREQYNLRHEDAVLGEPVHEKSRLLMQKKYGVELDVQLRLEAYFDNLKEIAPLNDPIITHLMITNNVNAYSQHDYASRYFVYVPAGYSVNAIH